EYCGSYCDIMSLKVIHLSISRMIIHAVTYPDPQGSSLQYTTELSSEIESELADLEHVDTVQADIGGQAMMGMGPDQASFTVITDPGADQAAVENRIQRSLDDWFAEQIGRAHV